jgi:hypothetical protein
MNTKADAPEAVGPQLVRGVRPVAEIMGGVLRWHIPEPDYALAQHYLRGVHLLYDQAALDAALNLWPRDCRLCANYRDGLTHAAHCVSVLRCEDSSAYRATQPVQFWEKRPVEPVPF